MSLFDKAKELAKDAAGAVADAAQTAGSKTADVAGQALVKPGTRRTFDADFAMVFTLKDGKVVRFREFTDSAGVNAAFA